MDTGHSTQQNPMSLGARHRYVAAVWLIIFFALGWGAHHAIARVKQTPPNTPAIYFSPRGGARQAIIDSVAQSRREILLALYYFTDPDLADSLIHAKQRGVAISIILDKSQKKGRYSQAKRLQAAGISVTFDTKHAIFHHKFMVIDEISVMSGSQNWTRSAEMVNAENVVILRWPGLSRQT